MEMGSGASFSLLFTSFFSVVIFSATEKKSPKTIPHMTDILKIPADIDILADIFIISAYMTDIFAIYFKLGPNTGSHENIVAVEADTGMYRPIF